MKYAGWIFPVVAIVGICFMMSKCHEVMTCDERGDCHKILNVKETKE